MKYIKSLDGLRAVAVIMVMLFHARLFDFGWIGVQIFFVLSGFLITGILLKEKEKPLGAYLGRFYWRRSLRIFPLYFGYLIALSALYYFTREPYRFDLRAPYLFTYTFNFTMMSKNYSNFPQFTHFWSLAVEEQFYLIWPLSIWLLSEKSLKRMVVCLILLIPAFRYGLNHYLVSQGMDVSKAAESVFFFTASHLDAFAVGGAIVIFGLKEKIESPWPVFAFTLVPVLALGWMRGYGSEFAGTWRPVWSYSTLNFLFAAAILILSMKEIAFFSNQILVEIGKISYGIYVLHWPIMFYYEKALAKFGYTMNFATFYFYALAVFGAAWVSYNFYEKRFLALKDSWVKISTPSHCIVQIEAPLCSPDQTSARDRIQA